MTNPFTPDEQAAIKLISDAVAEAFKPERLGKRYAFGLFFVPHTAADAGVRPSPVYVVTNASTTTLGAGVGGWLITNGLAMAVPIHITKPDPSKHN